jgi:prepilin-type N-terminal cleavage/methylation domain-containing protein
MKPSRQRSAISGPYRKPTDQPGRTGDAAFTLIELMVVVGIMALVMAIGIPFMANVVNGGKGISRAGRDVQQACHDTRALAILRQRPVELRIRPGDGILEFGAASQTGALSSEITGNDWRMPDRTQSGGAGDSSVKLPEGVVIEVLGVNGFDWTDDEVAHVRFYPNGTSDEMRMILYRPSTGERRYMHLEVVTGLTVLEETEVSEFTRVR